MGNPTLFGDLRPGDRYRMVMLSGPSTQTVERVNRPAGLSIAEVVHTDGSSRWTLADVKVSVVDSDPNP